MGGFKDMTGLLAVETAIADAINNDIKRGAGTLRDRCDELAMQMWEESGTRTSSLVVNGREVGTFSVSMGKERDVNSVQVTDINALVKWASENSCLPLMVSASEKAVLEWFEANGEVPDGCEVTTTHVAAAPKGTTVCVSTEFKREVRQMLDENVLRGASFAALLNGGE